VVGAVPNFFGPVRYARKKFGTATDMLPGYIHYQWTCSTPVAVLLLAQSLLFLYWVAGNARVKTHRR
jgi:hypothetical protein